MIHLTLIALVLAHLALAAGPKERIILDTDIGDDIDDAYALALLATDPQVDLLGVTTTYGPTDRRAQLAAKLLNVCGKPRVPVCAGRKGGGPIGDQYLWAKGYASKEISDETASGFIDKQLKKLPGEITIVSIGALTNMSDLLKEHPEDAAKIKRIVLMGGSINFRQPNSTTAMAEYNIVCDVKAAQKVFTSGVPITMAGLDVTIMMRLDEARQKRLYSAGSPVTDALCALTRLWGNPIPILYDPVAAAFAMGHEFCDRRDRHVEVGDDGITRVTPGAPNVTVLENPRPQEFLDWYVDSLAAAH